ncbi:hypothetical protein, partial [Sphaerisporangium flaviroseum]
AGGWLGGTAGWRMLYLPSVVVCALLLILCALLPRSTAGTQGRLPDLPGAALLLTGIAALVMAVTTSPMWNWSITETGALGGGGLLLIAVTVWRSTRHPVPVIEIGLWRSPMFAIAGVISVLHGLIIFPLLVTAPRFLHLMWSYPPQLVGLAMVPLSAGVLAASPIAGHLSRLRPGPRPVIYAGAVLVTIAGIWLIGAALRPGPALPQVWLPAIGLLGLGLGGLGTGATIAGTLSATPQQYAAAVGTAMTARQLGGAIGVAAAAGLLDHRFPRFGPIGGYLMVLTLGIAAALLAGVLTLFMPTGSDTHRSTAMTPSMRSPAPGITADPLPPAALIALYAAASSLVEATDALLADQRSCAIHPRLPPQRLGGTGSMRWLLSAAATAPSGRPRPSAGTRLAASLARQHAHLPPPAEATMTHAIAVTYSSALFNRLAPLRVVTDSKWLA